MDNSDGKETLLEFPCDFIIKVMGKSDQDFEEKILRIIKRHCAGKSGETIKKVVRRHSKNDNYLALTITIYAENKQQIDSLYIELSACPDVLMAL